MKLLRLHIENFGTLQDFTLTPVDGLNVLYQKNGWGKSTLAVFIKAMLFGLPAVTRRSLDENERKKYTPWQGGAFGGSLELECQAGRFRIERFFGAKEADDRFALYDLATNKPSSAFGANIGEELFGIDADGFERSTYLSQRALTGGRDSGSITAKLGGVLDNADDIGGYEAAMAALDKRRSYYIKTGNRGAIAEMEAELVSLSGELERCLQLEATKTAREGELADCNAELAELQKQLTEARRDLQKAGLGRERAAHAEQRATMQAELRRLIAERDRINDFFRNAPPSPAELGEGRRLYEEIVEVNAQADAVPQEIPEAKQLAELRHRYPKGIPPHSTLERIESDNNELISLGARLAALKDDHGDGNALSRFPKGAPDQAELDEARESLRQARVLQDAAVETERKLAGRAPTKPSPAIGIGVLAFGAVLAALSLLPSLAAFLLPLLIVGLAGATVGILLFVFARTRRKKDAHEAQKLARTAQKQSTESARLYAGLAELLEAYGIATATQSDVADGLDSLTVLTVRYRDARQHRRAREDSIRVCEARMEALGARLSACLIPASKETRRDNYRSEIDNMKAELTRLAYLEEAERRRVAETKRLALLLDEKQEALLPFLRRFDPAGKMRAGECLNYVAERSAEFERLKKEIRHRQETISVFVTEKQLDNNEPLPDTTAFDRITDAEQQLQERADDVKQRATALRQEIDRLSLDTDRIPDLTDAIALQKEKIKEAKAAADTVKHTAKLLEEAKLALSTRYLGDMQESFSTFLGQLLQTNAPEAVMDTSFEVSLRERGETRRMESFSRGWRDAVEFCTRLSLTEALYHDGERPFLLLDDPFVNLDDERLDAARHMLEALSKRYQILYLVCHKERI